MIPKELIIGMIEEYETRITILNGCISLLRVELLKYKVEIKDFEEKK